MPQAYFPPLDKCLAGEERLISWKTAYRALGDPETAVDETLLEAFLTDTDSVNYLTRPLDPFQDRSAKSKGDFETKTAPINVSQSSNGDYNLEELKRDAEWLSETVNVEELVALRLVILEWQQRAEDELRTAATGTGSAVVPASSGLSASNPGNGFGASANGSATLALDFSKEEIRRERQLAIYLEEKSHILMVTADLIGRIAIQDEKSETGRSWLDELADKVTEDLCSPEDPTVHDLFCASCIDAIDGCIQKLDDNSKRFEPFKSDDAKQLMYAATTVRDVVTALRLLLANLYMLRRVPSPQTVRSWFQLMARVKFFQDLTPSPVVPETSSLQCLVSIISLTIIQLPLVLNRLQESAAQMREGALYPQLPDDTYIRNDECIREVNLTLYRAAQDNLVIAAPTMYAWSLITIIIRDVARWQHEAREQQRIDDGSDDSEPVSRRRASRRDLRDDLSVFEKQLQLLQDFELESDARGDPPAFLARAAVDRMGVYGVISQLCTNLAALYGSESGGAISFISRCAVYELVREGMQMVSYGSEVLESVLTILSPDVPGRSNKLDYRLGNRFWSDHAVFRPALLDQAIARYPFELTPMLRLMTALASASNSRAKGSPDITAALESLQTLTVMVPEHFRSYALDHEDENMNSMVLTESLPLFVSKQAFLFYGSHYIGRAALTMGSGETAGTNILAIPSGTPGVVVKESRPLVFRLEHSHSGLEYLGLLVSTLLPNSELVVAPMDGNLDRATAAEIITLVTALITTCLRQRQNVDEAHFVLGRLSFALQDEQDIITIIADVLEVELLAFLDQSTQDGSLDLVVACVEFFDKLTEISPERVWSTLARSSLLGINGGANALAAVIAGIEVNLGRYRFLAACVSMYSHLITDAITGLVKRKSKVSKTTNRFDSPISFQDTTPERTMSTVLNAYQTVMIDAWQSLGEWRFAEPIEKCEITTAILKTFGRLLRCTYGISSREKGISALLYPSATALFDAFAVESGYGTTLQPFLAVFTTGLQADDDQLPSQQRRLLVQQTITAFEFLSSLIRTTKMVDETGKRANLLASQLLSGMPVFASLLATDHDLKSSLCALLGEIVQAINNTSTDPPSLLGQLNTSTAKSFLSVISQLDSPLRDVEVESTIWNFLSSVMSCKQQWFAIYLLTGTLPKDRLKDETTNGSATKSKSLLVYALEQLSSIATLAPERAITMLKFVASAQSSWVWATNEIRSHSDFLRSALDWLNNLQIPTRAPNIAEEIILANEHQMAAFLCDILAVNLQASNEIGDKAVLKMLSTKLSFLRQHGSAVNAYKKSLHRNLAENFARKFPSCEVADFKKTSSNLAPFGRKYFYDLGLADNVLGHEKAWHGALNGRNQGFADEFARANVNFSLVEAQTRLLKSWRVLATTLCECLDQETTLQGELARTAQICLNANVDANLEQPGMDDVVKIRAEMAFIIVSKLVSIKASDPAMRTLLSTTWDLVRSSPVDYDVATAPEDLVYYRTLLQVLYLAIQPHAYMTPQSTSNSREPRATEETKIDFLDPGVAACLVQIMSKVIAPGFRALCGNLHNSIDLAQPGDFALLTALLQAILSVPGVSAVHHQFADVVASTSIVRGALSLFSWSDQLAEVMGQDPIYGEVAMMFLLSLSTIRPVAEQMALDGVLVQLSSANLSNYFRKPGGKTPFSEPRRMFVIWSEGFLPLCLNLLDAVGPPFAAEVSTFLNSFPLQLQRANTALENREATRQNPYAGAITLGLASEAHSLCLIALILASDTARGAAEGIDAADVPALGFKYEKVKEDAAGLMRQKTSLASRIVPVGEREEGWSIGGAGLKGDNVLLGKVVKEVVGLLRCFGREE